MNHEEALLSAYLDDELSVQEKARVDAHLGVCPDCRRELEGLGKAKKRLAGAGRRAMPPDLIADIESRLVKPWRARWFPVLGRPQVLIPAGMLAAAGLIVGLWMGLTSREPDQYVPLEPLLAAHARYEAESLVPEDNMVADSYSLHVANADGGDSQQ